jgi:predicted phosphohydrolase
MPKLTKQERHKKREANRAKLHAKQRQPKSKDYVVVTQHQPGMAFRHSFDHPKHLHIVHLGLSRS